MTLAIAISNAAPAIDHLANNYSYIAADLPNYGIAQGSIFDIFGTNLSNNRTALQSAPLPTSLQGVTVDVTVNGTTTQAILYYASSSQIAAILPSATPVGDGTITVTNNGKMSPAGPIHVVQSAFGVLTLNGAGAGPAAAFDVNNQYLGFTNALNPGDYFVLWGTGVGPVSGDETITQTPANLTNIPFSIEVGGVPAQVYYRGRSQYPGLDQVIGIVPNGVTPGCWVSVVTLSGNVSSNFATLPIATTGRTCSDQAMGVTASQMESLLSKSSFNIGTLQLQKVGETQFNLAGNVNIWDAATTQFISVKPGDFSRAALGPSMGSCLVIQGGNGHVPGANLPSTPLDAGPAINITGPSGSAAVQYQGSVEQYAWSAISVQIWPFDDIPYQSAAGAYIGQIGSGQDLFISNSGGGTFTFENGSGGGNVGGFSVNLTLGSPLLGWPQRSSLGLANVNRSAGLSLTWSNGDANSFMQISGWSISSASHGGAGPVHLSGVVRGRSVHHSRYGIRGPAGEPHEPRQSGRIIVFTVGPDVVPAGLCSAQPGFYFHPVECVHHDSRLLPLGALRLGFSIFAPRLRCRARLLSPWEHYRY